jgi:hypothetical protein
MLRFDDIRMNLPEQAGHGPNPASQTVATSTFWAAGPRTGGSGAGRRHLGIRWDARHRPLQTGREPLPQHGVEHRPQ